MPLRSPAGALVPAVFVSDCGDAEEGMLWGRGSVSLTETSGPAPTTETASDSFLQAPLPHTSGWPGLRQLPHFSKSECLPKALHIPACHPGDAPQTGRAHWGMGSPRASPGTRAGCRMLAAGLWHQHEQGGHRHLVESSGQSDHGLHCHSKMVFLFKSLRYLFKLIQKTVPKGKIGRQNLGFVKMSPSVPVPDSSLHKKGCAGYFRNRMELSCESHAFQA